MAGEVVDMLPTRWVFPQFNDDNWKMGLEELKPEGRKTREPREGGGWLDWWLEESNA